MPDVTVNLELTKQEAWDLAQFVKRVGHAEVRSCAADNEEAARMLEAIRRLQIALADAGYAPR